jgi:hypothetical protein
MAVPQVWWIPHNGVNVPAKWLFIRTRHMLDFSLTWNIVNACKVQAANKGVNEQLLTLHGSVGIQTNTLNVESEIAKS